MNFRGVCDLRSDTRSLAHELSTDIDLVVGIPRSGMLAGSLLCLYLDVPLTDVDGLCARKLHDVGERFDDSVAIEDVEKALVIDDSVRTGAQMTETRDRLADESFPFDLEYAAIYVTPTGHQYVDRWSEIVTIPRVFEWNILHHNALQHFCVDIDGVLCRDPTPRENDDGKRYGEFLREVKPRRVPNKPIGWLVTCRLEKYREETEAWLARHGIEYDHLVMMDYPSKQARREANNHAAYKANVYEETGANLFIESSPGQAREILALTNKPVYCYEANELLQPGRVARMSNKSVDYVSRFRDRPLDFSQSAAQYLMRRVVSRIRRLS